MPHSHQSPFPDPNIKPLDVVVIGHAIVDIVASEHDTFLEQHGIKKGAMQLIDHKQQNHFYHLLAQKAEFFAGGSAANCATGIASLGGKVTFMGNTSSDRLADIFQSQIRSEGVTFAAPYPKGFSFSSLLSFRRNHQRYGTGVSFTLLTPDNQCSMLTYLGSASYIKEKHIDFEAIAQAKILHIEGYLWNLTQTKETLITLLDYAKSQGTRISFGFDDVDFITQNSYDFQQLVRKYADYIFASEKEMMALAQTTSLADTITWLQSLFLSAALIDPEKGAKLITPHDILTIPPRKLGITVDTTGTGDYFIAGILYGLTHGYSLEQSGHIGALASAAILLHNGAHPQMELKALMESELDFVQPDTPKG